MELPRQGLPRSSRRVCITQGRGPWPNLHPVFSPKDTSRDMLRIHVGKKALSFSKIVNVTKQTAHFLFAA